MSVQDEPSAACHRCEHQEKDRWWKPKTKGCYKKCLGLRNQYGDRSTCFHWNADGHCWKFRPFAEHAEYYAQKEEAKRNAESEVVKP